MRSAKPQYFHASGKNFTGNDKFQGTIYQKPDKSPEDKASKTETLDLCQRQPCLTMRQGGTLF